MSKKIFLNYVEIYFLFNYECICALDNIFSIRIRRKLVFVSLFLFKILSDLHFYTQNENLPDKLFLFYCLSSCKDHKDNSRDRFMQYFDSTYIFGTVNYFMSKYLPENNDKHIKWKTIINEKKILNEEKKIAPVDLSRRGQLDGIIMLEKYFALIYYK
ncbi:hypothetical protein GVAV_000431 [Gurleya vavrai]